MGFYRGSRKGRKGKGAAVLILGAALAVFAIFTAKLYRHKKEVEAQIAAREYTQQEIQQSLWGEAIKYHGKTYRRSSYVKAILCMGVDREGSMKEKTTHTFGGQADGIFVIAQDTTRNTLKILMIPRDTMTEITLTDLSGNVLGKDIQHLTLAYAYGDGREESCERMVEAVSGLLNGMELDHYLAADTDVIAALNDAAGGVEVTVTAEGMEKADPAFQKGAKVTLFGDQAEAFVRYRDTDEAYSAIARMERQQGYISGFFRSVKEKSKEDSQIVLHLFELTEEHMVTDMGKEEYLKIAMDALNSGELGAGDFYTLPGESAETNLFDEFYVDKEALMPILLELFYREVL